jgi:4a-hydroxytetrahydrobiopterin dehydratase
MSELANRHCEPCSGKTPRLQGEEIATLHQELHADWRVVDGHHLERTFKLKDFATALALTDRIGALAEDMQHHPDLQLGWGKVQVVLFTHKIGGLSESDFVLAARIDRVAA